MATYPQEYVQRINLVSIGSSELPTSASGFAAQNHVVLEGFKSHCQSGLRMRPTKFMLDQFNGIDLVPFIRNRYPGVPVYLHFSPSTAALYVFLCE